MTTILIIDDDEKLDGRNVELTTSEFAAPALLAAKPGNVFDRDQILQFCGSLLS